MSLKEFSLKMLRFIMVPSCLLYSVRSCQEASIRQLTDFRACVRALQRTPTQTLTIYGDSATNCVTSIAALHQVPARGAALQWTYVPVGQYRSSPRSYRLAVTTTGRPPTDIYLYQTDSGQEVVAWAGDSVYVDKGHRLFALVDSLYHHTASCPAPILELR